MESIASKALPLVEDAADPAAVDDDWIIHFFDQCRNVNSDQMQGLWSRALAGEANAPGSFSKRTVTALAGLDATEAKWFTALCSYVFVVDTRMYPLVFNVEDMIYNKLDITFSSLNDLASIGLVRVGGIAGFKVKGLPRECTAYYYERALRLWMPKESGNDLSVGKVLFTRIGKELAPICGSRPIDGFWEYVTTQWKDFAAPEASET